MPYWPERRNVFAAHLRASDTYRTHLRVRALLRLLPDAYGLALYSYDEHSLSWRGELVVPQVLSVFASGLEAWADPEQPLEADVQTRLYGLTTSVAVHLAVPKAVIDGANIDLGGKGASTRYVGALTDNPPGMRPKLEIVFDGVDSKGRYDRSEVLTLGRVERNGATTQFVPTTWPTVIHASACAPMMASIRDVIDALATRKRELLKARAAHPFDLLGDDIPQDEHDLLVIINPNLALLRALVARTTTRPYQFYQRLRDLYLRLASFEEELEQSPSYTHDNLGTVFPWLVARVRNLVERVARTDRACLPFTRGDTPGLFTLTFRAEDLPKWKRPILVAKGADTTWLEERLPALIKIAAPARIEHCKRSAVKGVRVRLELDAPHPVPTAPGIVAYTLLRNADRGDPNGLSSAQFWSEIVDANEIHVYLPNEHESLQLDLYCVDREA